FNTALTEQIPEAEDLALAIRELLIPQAGLLLISAVELARLSETWKDNAEAEADDLSVDAMTLIESGCQFVLVTGTPGATGEVANT
ncbi:hypothetical protein, partial [Pseudomonas sp. AB12(2023)]